MDPTLENELLWQTFWRSIQKGVTTSVYDEDILEMT